MNPVPHPLAPEQRAVTAQDLAWLIGSFVLVIAPHAQRAPWWLTLLTLCLYGWRMYYALNRLPKLAPTWLVLAVAAVGMLGVWLEFRTLFGRSSGILLLMLFSGLKLLETRTHRDAALAAFLAYFLIITNLLYTQSIPTALLMAAALVVVTTALIGLAAPHRPATANVRTAGLLLAHAAPAALVLFLLFPRVQGPLWGLPQDAYSGTSGLGESMTPGNLSQLALSDAIAFRVEFDGPSPEQRQLYWRGPVLWDFDGRTWNVGPKLLADFEPPAGGRDTYRYTIILEPHNRHWMFALETAAVLPPTARYSMDGQLVSPAPVRTRLRYDMVSIAEADPRPGEDPILLRRALQLPPGFNPEARALAAQWRREASGDAEVVSKAIAYLRAGKYQYTLEPALLGEHSVDDFLFRTREGFCEHFASAFTFLMRAAGIPARVVTGYQGGDLNPVDRVFSVRQAEAHAWSEVYLVNRGWTRVDPTIASNPLRLESSLARSVPNPNALPFLSRTDYQWLRSLRHQWEAVAHRWNVWVLGYNLERQRHLFSFVGIPDADWRSLTATLFTLLGLFTAGLIVWSLRRYVRPDPVQIAWRAFCRKLASRGLERAAHEGPRDYAERAARALPNERRAILHIGALYIALRYGAERSAQAVDELRRRVRELRLT